MQAMGGSLFDIQNCPSLGEIAFKGLANSGVYLACKGLSEVVKSDFAKKKIKNVTNKYIDKALDSFTSDLSKKISGEGVFYPGTLIPDFNPQNIKMMKAFIKATRGKGVNVHAMIGKLPKPKGGWTLPGHKYTRPYMYNDLENQVRWDPKTGEILEIYQQPTGMMQ